MRLSKKEVDYIVELSDAFSYPYLCPSVKQVLYMRADGLTFSEIDRRRSASGSSQLYTRARNIITVLNELSLHPLLGSHCFALSRTKVKQTTSVSISTKLTT